MGITSKAIVAGCVLLSAGGLAACSADEPSSNGPYAAQFAQARDQALTDFQRDVLSDDRITDEEFRETRQKYIDCLADAGMHATARPDGGYDFAPAPTAKQEADEIRCSMETTRLVEPLYYSLQVNPDDEDFSALIAECLKQQGVVDDTFGKDEWDQYVTAFSAASNAAADATGGEPPVAVSDLPRLPGGVAMDDPRVQKCSNNPLGL